MRTWLVLGLSLISLLGYSGISNGTESQNVEPKEVLANQHLIAGNYSFNLTNNSNKNVCIAKAGYFGGRVRPDVIGRHYYAEGWYCVAPNSTRRLFPGGNNKIMLHILKGIESVIPNGYTGEPRSMCVVGYPFKTREYTKLGGGNTLTALQPGKKSFIYGGKSGKTCTSEGGIFKKFYNIKRNANLTVN